MTRPLWHDPFDTVKRIAEELTISLATVRTHKKRVYAKPDVHKHEELMQLVRSSR